MPKKTKEEKERDIELGDKDEDIYTEEGREVAEEEGEITEVEEGFMEGYDEDDEAVKCTKCGKVLQEDYVEEEIKGKTLKFCSVKCANNYRKKR